jgi:hypothetical protein
MNSWLVEQMINAVLAIVASFFHSIGIAGIVICAAGAMLAAALSKKAMRFFTQPRGMAVSAAIVALGLLWAWWTWPAPAMEPSLAQGTSAASVAQPEGQLGKSEAAVKPEHQPMLGSTAATPTVKRGQVVPMAPMPFIGGPGVTVVPQFSGGGMIRVPAPIRVPGAAHGHLGGGAGGQHVETVIRSAPVAEGQPHPSMAVPGFPAHEAAVPAPEPPKMEEEAPPPPPEPEHRPTASAPPPPEAKAPAHEPEGSPAEARALTAHDQKALNRENAKRAILGLPPVGSQAHAEGGMNGRMMPGQQPRQSARRGGMNNQQSHRGMMPQQGGMNPGGFAPMPGRVGRRR